jgi:16S rRNA (uracil1498-N3)-methyltransferase
MAPFFYIPFLADASVIELDADTSHHIAQVLRMQVGEPLYLTDGNGHKIYGQLTSVAKRSCVVQVAQRTVEPFFGRNVHLTVAPIKNNSRFEWLIEKATELGVRSIRPILTARTEKQRLRIDRLKQISIAAMLQSQQVWLPKLDEPISISDHLMAMKSSRHQRLIAHCVDAERTDLSQLVLSDEVELLIGPEGDFTELEISQALEAGYSPVLLGATRLRTETAGVVGSAWLRLQR